MNQNIGNRTRSKVHALWNENIDINFFPSYDAIKFQNQSKTKGVVLPLGVTECKVYKRTLTESKSKCQFEYLH
jgi:hypothetical protein